MPGNNNQYTETTTRGWGSRIVGSVQGVVFGFIIFIAAFALIFWNEGRIDKSEIAETAVTIGSETVESSADGQLVTTRGTLTSPEKIGDAYVRTGPYIALERKVEMFAWVESSSSESEVNLGGSETTTTTYDYSNEWTSSPQDSGSFKVSEGHFNPDMTLDSTEVRVKSAKVGVYDIDPSSIAMPGSSPLELTRNNTTLRDGTRFVNSSYLFKGDGSLDEPEVGDIRISYSVVNADQEVTVFGKLEGSKINPFIGEKNSRLYQLSYGTSDEAVASLASSHKMSTWFLRILGLFMIWFGLSSILGPISVLLDVLPFLGALSRGITGGVTFLVSLVIWIIAVLVSMMVHNLIAMIAAAAIAAFVIFWFVSRKAANKPV